FLCFQFAITPLCSFRKLSLIVRTKVRDYLLGNKGMVNTGRILIWRKVLGSRVCHGSTNFSLYRLTLFITCLLLLLLSKIPDRLRGTRRYRHHLLALVS